MDKRYILIFIIIIVCCVNLSVIANSSDIIGSASVEGGHYIFSIPSGFSLYESNNNHVLIHNGDSGMYIDIFLKISKDNYQSKLKEINKDKDYIILSNGSLSVEDINIDAIYYQNVSNHENRSTFYFNKFDNNFRITMLNFNYENDKNMTIEYISDIVSSVRVNYKK